MYTYFWDTLYNCCRQSTCSIARGEGGGAQASPIGLKNMQNSTFLVLLRPIFAPKMKTSPPKRFGSRSCEGLAVVWTRIVEFFGSGAHPKSVKTYFLEITRFRPEKTFEFLILAIKTLWISVKTFFFCFCLEITSIRPEKNPWISDFGRKKPFNFGEDLFFFGDHLILTEKPLESNLRLIKIWVKFVFGWIKLPKKPPPPFAKSLLRYCNR